ADLMRRARCDANWHVAAERPKGLAATFGITPLNQLGEEAMAGAPGDPAVLRRITIATDAISRPCPRRHGFNPRSAVRRQCESILAVLPWQRERSSRVTELRSPRQRLLQRRDFDVPPFSLDARDGDGGRSELRADDDRRGSCRG